MAENWTDLPAEQEARRPRRRSFRALWDKNPPHAQHEGTLLEHEAEAALPSYEGLIFVHSQRVLRIADPEEVRQFYRLKAWRALLAFEPSQARPGETAARAEGRFVFMCLKNAEKDVLKRKRRHETYIEDEAAATGGGHERFQSEHLSVDHEQVYSSVEDDPMVLPSTLTAIERKIVALLTADYRPAEIQALLEITRRRSWDCHMRSIRAKLGDWRPLSDERADGKAKRTHPRSTRTAPLQAAKSGLESRDTVKPRAGSSRARDPLPAAA